MLFPVSVLVICSCAHPSRRTERVLLEDDIELISAVSTYVRRVATDTPVALHSERLCLPKESCDGLEGVRWSGAIVRRMLDDLHADLVQDPPSVILAFSNPPAVVVSFGVPMAVGEEVEMAVRYWRPYEIVIDILRVRRTGGQWVVVGERNFAIT